MKTQYIKLSASRPTFSLLKKILRLERGQFGITPTKGLNTLTTCLEFKTTVKLGLTGVHLVLGTGLIFLR